MTDVTEYYKARHEAEKAAGKKVGCTATLKGNDITSDHAVCSCGWKSRYYYDGKEFAWDDWLAHIRSRGARVTYPATAGAVS